MKDTLYIWAEEGGIELKLSPHPEFAHQAIVEIVTRGREEIVLARATMASFRHQRIADWFTQAEAALADEVTT